MSTQPETVEFILEKLDRPRVFSVRAMFGEYALYASGRVIALVCDDLLYVKILPASAALEKVFEKDAPYPSAKPHYVVSEEQLTEIEDLPDILQAIARSLPVKKKKAAKKRRV